LLKKEKAVRAYYRHFAAQPLSNLRLSDSLGYFFGFALYFDRSRDARPLPRGLTGHVAHPLRSILHRGQRERMKEELKIRN